MINDVLRQAIGVGFAFLLFAVCEYVLFLGSGSCFVLVLLGGNPMPVYVFAAGCIIGMAWEYMGQFTWRWWHYPMIDLYHPFLAVLPFFWGLFMLIIQDGYAIARIYGLNAIPAASLSNLLLGILIEGMNLYTRSWRYLGILRSYTAVAVFWLFFISFTFVVGFNAVVINPFGY
jgi:hypothetical protein